jgi:hypothetical protein
VGSGSSHELYATAGSCEGERPDGVFAGEAYYIGELTGKEAFAIVPFRHCRGLRMYVILNWTSHKISQKSKVESQNLIRSYLLN